MLMAGVLDWLALCMITAGLDGIWCWLAQLGILEGFKLVEQQSGCAWIVQSAFPTVRSLFTIAP